jgi:2-polyprenyl-6-methoxyphenol hydroxylase-like FAD-dependent oxidoreductase
MGRGNLGPILIAGGGIGGLSAAIAVRQAGLDAQVFEQATALDEVGAGVSLWPNATRALARLGVAERVVGGHVPLTRIEILRADGSVLLRLDDPGRYAEPSVCVHRAHLQRVLAAAVPAEALHLGRQLIGFVADEGGVTAAFSDGYTVRGALLIGCDGIRSTVRARLHGAAPARQRGYEIWRGLCDYDLPDDLLRQSTEWWGPGHRFGILPGEPGRVYWYATRTARSLGGSGEGSGEGSAGLPPRKPFAEWPSPVPELLAASMPVDPVRTEAEDRTVPRRWGRGRVTLLGDAAHPMTPNMGQGACTAIEDAVVLGRCLERYGPSSATLRRYERLRASRTRRIVRQSRRIGWLAQLTSPALVAVRDQLIRLIPDPALSLPQRWVYGYRA